MSTLMEAISPALIGSRSHCALCSAYMGEINAQQMYLFAACRMEEASLHVIAHALRFTAAQEKEHSDIFRGLITAYGGTHPTTAEDAILLPDEPAAILRIISQGEADEAERLYPFHARVAAEEGYPRIAAAFQRIAETETLHARRFRQYEQALTNGDLFRADAPVSWVCLPCGQLHTGCEPPDTCAFCGKDRGHFIRSSYYPFSVEG